MATMEVANNNNSNNDKQGHKGKDSASHSVVLKKVTPKAHNPSLEKCRSSSTEQKERRHIRPRRPSPEIVEYIDLAE